jgi:two-component system sensor histidine kinase/response regulator
MAEILIVEDAEENIIFLSEILESEGHEFRIARNGREALEALREKRPDLVLLDIMMPRKSGVNVLADMRKDAAMADIKVIMVTGATEVTGVSIQTGEPTAEKAEYQDDMAQRFGEAIHEKLGQLTPDAIVEKPIDPPALIAKINELIG